MIALFSIQAHQMAIIKNNYGKNDNIIDAKYGVFLYESGNKQGIGTSFLMADNVFVTSNHVIKTDFEGSTIETYSGNLYKPIKILGDNNADVALFKLSDDDWKKFKNENRYTILKTCTKTDDTEPVYSIGHPSYLLWTISKGIVSNSKRHNTKNRNFYIQTDAEVHPGNSGGPLLDFAGCAIGINSIMVQVEGGSFGAATPVAVVNKVISDMKKYGQVRYSFLGVETDNNGTLNNVLPNSPALKAGLLKGDKILAFNGKILENYKDFLYDIMLHDYDKPAILIIKRNNQIVEIVVEKFKYEVRL